MKELEIVVARYKEDISPLRSEFGSLLTVYNKFDGEENRLPNVGRETHTYFHHIVNRYDSLANRTVFLQGSPWDHCAGVNLKKAVLAEGDFREIGHDNQPSEADGMPHGNWGKKIGVGELWETLFKTKFPRCIDFVIGAQFSVRKELITRLPRSFYERCLELSVSREDGPWEFERLWRPIFTMNVDDVRVE